MILRILCPFFFSAVHRNVGLARYRHPFYVYRNRCTYSRLTHMLTWWESFWWFKRMLLSPPCSYSYGDCHQGFQSKLPSWPPCWLLYQTPLDSKPSICSVMLGWDLANYILQISFPVASRWLVSASGALEGVDWWEKGLLSCLWHPPCPDPRTERTVAIDLGFS